MSTRKHPALMLAIADRDIGSLLNMLDPKLHADEAFGFFAQQAAEKLLKAWLSGLGVNYELTHDIARLLAVLRVHGQDIDSLDPLIDLTYFAVEGRYSLDDDGEEPPVDRQKILHEVVQLRARVAVALDLCSGQDHGSKKD